jgi:hypothetical protein
MLPCCLAARKDFAKLERVEFFDKALQLLVGGESSESAVDQTRLKALHIPNLTQHQPISYDIYCLML